MGKNGSRQAVVKVGQGNSAVGRDSRRAWQAAEADRRLDVQVAAEEALKGRRGHRCHGPAHGRDSGDGKRVRRLIPTILQFAFERRVERPGDR